MSLAPGDLTQRFRANETLAGFVVEAGAIVAPAPVIEVAPEVDADFKAHTARAQQKIRETFDDDLMAAKGGAKEGLNNVGFVIRANQDEVEKERKKRERDADLIAQMMTAEELGAWLDQEIDDTRQAIETAQARLTKAQRQRSALDAFAVLSTGELDPLNPEHEALYQQTNLPQFTGAETLGEYVERYPTQEEQNEVIAQAGQVLDAEIDGLVTEMNGLLERLNIVTEAKRALDEGADPQEVLAGLERAGIVVEVADGNSVLDAVGDDIDELVDFSEGAFIAVEHRLLDRTFYYREA